MRKTNSETGNVLVYILIAIVLLGMLSATLRTSTNMEENIDREKASVIAGQILKQSSELSRAVQTLIENGISENDIRFAHPKANVTYGTITTNPQNQVFSGQGGNATYREIPSGASTGTSVYGFAGDQSMPQVGSSRADLIGYAPNLNDAVCNSLNAQLGLTTKPSISNCAVPTAFAGTFASSPNVLPESSFQTLPALQACVACTNWSSNVFFFALLAR